MALPPNAQPVPTVKAPTNPADKAEADRQKAIRARQQSEQDKINKANSAAKSKAEKKKGVDTYKVKSIEGNPDYGIGKAGPGTPYSVKTTTKADSSLWPNTPKMKLPKPTIPSNGLPDWTKGQDWPKVNGLWPVGNTSPMKSPNWQLQAIRRRLNNG